MIRYESIDTLTAMEPHSTDGNGAGGNMARKWPEVRQTRLTTEKLEEVDRRVQAMKVA